MGNARSSNAGGHRRSHPLIPNRLQPHMGRTRNAFGPAGTPFPSQFPNPNAPPYYQYPGYYPPPPLPGPYGVPNGVQTNWVRGQWQNPAAAPLVDHQKAVTVRNDVNLKKDSLRVEADEENPGKFLVAFTFDAAVPGRITIMFFAKEGADHNLIATKKKQFKPVTVSFEQGLDQKFRQPSGTGIDFSMLEEMEAIKDGVQDVYPLVVKADALGWNDSNSNVNAGANLQITQAVFVKDRNYYNVRVMKQVLWVNGNRYELQEIYGIGNAVNDDIDSNDSGKECVICLSEPRDTTVLPCRHMCMCCDCANILRFQTNRCPICRQPVEQLLEIKVGNDGDD